MQNVKIILTVYTEGATLRRESKPQVIKVKQTFKTSKGQKLTKVVGNTIHYDTKPLEAKQNIKLTKEAYYNFINNPHKDIKPAEWRKMSKTKRLEAQLAIYANTLGSSKFSYEVLED